MRDLFSFFVPVAKKIRRRKTRQKERKRENECTTKEQSIKHMSKSEGRRAWKKNKTKTERKTPMQSSAARGSLTKFQFREAQRRLLQMRPTFLEIKKGKEHLFKKVNSDETAKIFCFYNTIATD